MRLAVALTVEKRFRLAVASDNVRIQIAAWYRALTDERGPQRFTDSDRTLVTELPLKVASDTPRWAAWTALFVGYTNAAEAPTTATATIATTKGASLGLRAFMICDQLQSTSTGRYFEVS
jgi:hypothetical protein